MCTWDQVGMMPRCFLPELQMHWSIRNLLSEAQHAIEKRVFWNRALTWWLCYPEVTVVFGWFLFVCFCLCKCSHWWNRAKISLPWEDQLLFHWKKLTRITVERYETSSKNTYKHLPDSTYLHFPVIHKESHLSPNLFAYRENNRREGCNFITQTAAKPVVS